MNEDDRKLLRKHSASWHNRMTSMAYNKVDAGRARIKEILGASWVVSSQIRYVDSRVTYEVIVELRKRGVPDDDDGGRLEFVEDVQVFPTEHLMAKIMLLGAA